MFGEKLLDGIKPPPNLKLMEVIKEIKKWCESNTQKIFVSTTPQEYPAMVHYIEKSKLFLFLEEMEGKAKDE